MGKNKRNKQRRKLTKSTIQSVGSFSNRTTTSDTNNTAEIRSVYSELISIDDQRRLRACRLLSNIFAFNTTNISTIEKMTNHEVFNRLIMRIVDSNTDVKFEAIGAIRNLATCDVSSFADRIVGCGTVEALLSIKPDLADSSLRSEALISQLLHCLRNLIICHEIFASKISSCSEQFVNFIITSFLAGATLSEMVLSSTIEFFLAATDNIESICKQIISLGGVSLFTQLLHRSYKHMSYPTAEVNAKSGETAKVETRLILPLKLVGILLNLCEYLNDSDLHSVINGDVRIVLSEALDLLKTADSSATVYSTIAMETEHSTDPVQTVTPDDKTSFVGGNILFLTAQFVQTAFEMIGNTALLVTDRVEFCRQGQSHAHADTSATIDGIISSTVYLSNATTVTTFINQINVLFPQFLALTASILNPSETDSEHVEKELHNAITILELIDHANITINNVLLLAQYSTQYDSTQIHSSSMPNSNCFPFTPESLVSLIESSTKTIDTLFQILDTISLGRSEYQSAISSTGLPELCRVCAVGALECVATIGRYAPHNLWRCQPSAFLQSITLLLCRGINQSDIEISNVCVNIVSVIANRDNEIDVSNNNSISSVFIWSHRLNALLTNSIVKKLELIRASNQVDTSSLVLLGSLLDSLVDLHSSDDLLILETYTRMNVERAIQAAVRAGHNMITQNQMQSNSMTLSFNNESGTNDIDRSHLDMLQDTLMNASNLVEYKTEFVASAGVHKANMI